PITMRLVNAAALVVATVVAAVTTSAAVASASNVVDLTAKDFDKALSRLLSPFTLISPLPPATLSMRMSSTIIDGSRPALVEFYASIYEDLADGYAKYKDDLVIAKIDADVHRDIGARFEVKGFPTIKWFPKGSTKPEDYSGGRDMDSLVKFVTEKT
ncbi:hypothetical protein HK405_000829, partial [Cladochytrium tenue]